MMRRTIRIVRSAVPLTLLLLLCGRFVGCGGSSSSYVGSVAPPIAAKGWFNGPRVTEGDLKGRVIVVDAWASWCGPCKRAAPELVAVHQQYSPQGVVFVGLSPEGREDLGAMEAFVEDVGIPWPNGYGATGTLSDLRVEYFPTVLVIGADNRIAWSNHDQRGLTLPEALDRALRAAGPRG